MPREKARNTTIGSPAELVQDREHGEVDPDTGEVVQLPARSMPSLPRRIEDLIDMEFPAMANGEEVEGLIAGFDTRELPDQFAMDEDDNPIPDATRLCLLIQVQIGAVRLDAIVNYPKSLNAKSNAFKLLAACKAKRLRDLIGAKVKGTLRVSNKGFASLKNLRPA